MNKEQVVTEIKVLRDIDLLDGKKVGVHQIAIIYRLTDKNWVELTKHNPVDSFKKAIEMYGCDICERHTHENNPIYTSQDFQGMDICTICIEKAFKEGLKKIEGVFPGPVYSLKKIKEKALTMEAVPCDGDDDVQLNPRDYVKGGMILNKIQTTDNRKRKEIDLFEENKLLKEENEKLKKKIKLIEEILN